MKSIKMVILAVIAILVIAILTITTEKKDEFRQEDIQAYSKTYLPQKIAKCLKKRGYSVDNPTQEQKEECEAFAKEALNELIILNSNNN